MAGSEAQENNMDKDKLFLVLYLNVGNINIVDVPAYVENTAKALKMDESVMTLIVPVREESRVECINPVLLTDEQYKDVEEKIKRLTTEIEEAIKNLKDD